MKLLNLNIVDFTQLTDTSVQSPPSPDPAGFYPPG